MTSRCSTEPTSTRSTRRTASRCPRSSARSSVTASSSSEGSTAPWTSIHGQLGGERRADHALDSLTREAREMKRFVFAGATVTELDKQGRVLVPPDLARHAASAKMSRRRCRRPHRDLGPPAVGGPCQRDRRERRRCCRTCSGQTRRSRPRARGGGARAARRAAGRDHRGCDVWRRRSFATSRRRPRREREAHRGRPRPDRAPVLRPGQGGGAWRADALSPR